MRALVTGSAGFIGRHMVRELRARGYTVTGKDPVTSGWHIGNCLNLFNGISHVYDLVVHCAYHVGGRSAIDGVNLNFAKNLQLDAALFEWAIRTQQRRVLYFSSSAAYPVGFQSDYRPRKLYEDLIALNEQDPKFLDYDWPVSLTPDANYGWAKLTGERLAADARKNGLAVTVVRPFSGYGEDQSEDYPFPSIVRRASAGDLTVWGPRGQTRDWVHVSDVVAGALAVCESGTEDPVNLCTGVPTEMGQLAQTVYGRANGLEWHDKQVTYDESRPTGVFYRVGDPTRMLQHYTPKVSLEEGIARALRAYS
jgi:nucleoside-diphosphate-sugar epimerase